MTRKLIQIRWDITFWWSEMSGKMWLWYFSSDVYEIPVGCVRSSFWNCCRIHRSCVPCHSTSGIDHDHLQDLEALQNRIQRYRSFTCDRWGARSMLSTRLCCLLPHACAGSMESTQNRLISRTYGRRRSHDCRHCRATKSAVPASTINAAAVVKCSIQCRFRSARSGDELGSRGWWRIFRIPGESTATANTLHLF